MSRLLDDSPPPGAQGLGAALDRVDGPRKVTGAATYAYEYDEAAAYGFIVEAAIGRGRLVSLDTTAAAAVPGVLMVMSRQNAPPQAPFPPLRPEDWLARPRPQFGDDQIRHFGQPIALVVAESFEAARAAAALVRATYAPEAGDFRLEPDDTYAPPSANAGQAAETRRGDFEAAFAGAAVKIDASFVTPYQIHASMEPHTTLAVWAEGRLTLYTSTQMLLVTQKCVADTLLIPADHVRVVSRYIGGGFGSKLTTAPDAICAALAARALGRPVKVALTRQQMFSNADHRGEAVQRVRLGAQPDGRLVAFGHEAWLQSTRHTEFVEQAAAVGRGAYAAENRLTRHYAAALDLPPSGPMRAPGEAIGSIALEVAMDELAEAVDLDPIELRRRNEPAIHPERRVPYSERSLVACMEEGARLFGWGARQPPRTRREGRQWVGLGMAAAIRPNYLRPCRAKLSLDADGTATLRMAMTDIGTGTYTVVAQAVSGRLGVPIEAIRVELGDSDFPPAPGSGGSFGAAASASATDDAARAAQAALLQAALADPASPLYGASADSVVFEEGRLRSGNRSVALGELVARRWPEGLTTEGGVEPTDAYQRLAQYSYGAQFAEVAVDADTGETRVRRMLGVFGVGRVLNRKTARSQMLGGMIWGIGAALHEEAVVDARDGGFVTRDLASYHVASHADAPPVEVVFLDETDPAANPLGAKGVGEVGICGAAAAVANAIYNAVGLRVRNYPITPDKLLAGL